MKKQLLLLTFLVCTNLIVAQKVDWIFSIQSNNIKVGIEDEIDADYSGGLVNTFPDPLNQIQFKINRKTQTKMGLEIGAKARFEIFEQAYLMSGIDFVKYNFYRVEWIENHSDWMSDYAPPFFPEVLRFSSIGIPTLDILRTVHIEGGYSKERPLVLSQRMTQLRFPLCLGVSSQSDKLFFYCGIWYSVLINYQYHNSEEYDWEVGELMRKKGFGANLGFQVAVFKKCYLKLDYTISGSNIYADKYKLASRFEGDFPKGENVNTFSFGLAYKL